MKREFILTICVLCLVCVLMLSSFMLFQLVVPFKYKNEIIEYSKEYGIKAEFVASVINAESRFDSQALSPKGAVGLMQLMFNTAKSFYDGDNFDKEVLLEPKENIKIGCKYLKYLFDKYNDEITVLACYNAGERVVSTWMNGFKKLEKTQIKYKETLNYIEKVQKYEKIYKFYF